MAREQAAIAVEIVFTKVPEHSGAAAWVFHDTVANTGELNLDRSCRHASKKERRRSVSGKMRPPGPALELTWTVTLAACAG